MADIATPFGDDELMRRAYAAYFRHGGEGLMQPSHWPTSTPVKYDGKTYVALANSHQMLAVYRVRNDGMLKGLKRWPAAINEALEFGPAHD